MKVLRFFFCAGLVASCLLLHVVKGDATGDLQAVQEAFFRWLENQSPFFSTSIGVSTYNNRLANLSMEVFDPQRTAIQQFITTTSSIDRNQLDRQHQYSYDIFMDMLNTFVSNYDWRNYGALNPVNFLEGFYLDLNYIIDITPFDSKQDFENYISRLTAWPTQISQMIDRMQEAIRLGTTYHNVSMRAVPGQLGEVIQQFPRDSTLFKPFNQTLDGLQLPQADRDDLRTRAQAALQNLWTALGQLKTFIEKSYSVHTRGTYGVGGLPSGGSYYRACLKWHLSVDTPPAQVHQIGLREVERISQLMQQVMTKQSFNGSISQYYDHLKADPQFHKSSANDVLQAYKDIIFNRIMPKLPMLFKNIPPSKIEVKPLPYDGPYGMYMEGSEDGSRPGTFYANVMRPNETNTFGMVSLTLHEAVPGHHMQSIYQMASGLPNFQKHIDYENYYAVPYHFPFYTAYTEGWALYAEYLGEEMGVYANDYELMGRYGDEMFRACRLVVDTGLHYFGWTREKAIKYLSARTPQPPNEVAIEIDRYITWPGQACAYKIGELKIKELRQKAATALGSNFDVRDFHSLLLDNGPVPLSVMETMVSDFIADHGGHSGQTGGSIIG